jgi:hypothetical protein
MDEELNLKEMYKDTLRQMLVMPFYSSVYIFAYDLRSWKEEYALQRCYFFMSKTEGK